MKIRLVVQSLFAIFCLTLTYPLFGQENFSVATINPLLLADADAVIRLDETYWEIMTKGEGKLRSRLVVTILNEKGEEEHSQLMVGYDKFTKIGSIDGNLYDAAGKLIRKLKNADIEDYGYGGAGDEITDARVKLADFGKKAIHILTLLNTATIPGNAT
ncbi:DUF3857 domain-containing protein [Dyadobacter sp. NIV53]|uniref:DUF3857 domain-containing protein n=1 Tax=Dyadobacter sp. NIV53 TaxID=2861765 RepID=UPI001C869721|nr:DUF3857 domain-containing protein [Dyadobacter sp. NIV53]